MQRRSQLLPTMEADVYETAVMESSGEGVENKQKPPNQLPLHAWMQIQRQTWARKLLSALTPC